MAMWLPTGYENMSLPAQLNADPASYTADHGLQHGAVFACVSALCRALSAAPLVIEERKGGHLDPLSR